jgi:L-ascorbate metabolism protein UlaG (beta-lactamase superfamily)
MIITWYGQSCFSIQGEKSTLVTDPFGDKYGLRLPKLAADVVTVSHDHDDHNNVAAIGGAGGENKPFLITDPGEYERRGIFVYGIPSFHDGQGGSERGKNIIYRIEFEGISIAHLGDLGHALEPEQREKLEGVDIVMVPVGGTYTIDGKEAAALVNDLEPRIIIPMHYDIPGLKLSKPIDDLDRFCNQIGICPKESIAKLKITKKELPQDQMQVITLTP